MNSQPASNNGPRGEVSFRELHRQVINPGLCTHCGTCVALAEGALKFIDTEYGPLPSAASPGREYPNIPASALDACPGKGLDYPALNEFLFGTQPDDRLVGHVRKAYIGYATDPEVRRSAASGGVITQSMLYLLERGAIEGALTLRPGEPEPWSARPVIAGSTAEIKAASQSVYVPIPLNLALGEIGEEHTALGYVGLPDQVASLRRLQQLGDDRAKRVQFVLGPYVGTSMYASSIAAFLRAHGVQSPADVEELRYREGEWPGNLYIRTKSGQEIRSPKFYYNYLIPFFITRTSLLNMDFTNELTDISVGDAWSPKYESMGQGYSVVLARSTKGLRLLEDMQHDGVLSLEPVAIREALSMHGHMLDFKKRGAYLRGRARRLVGLPAPDYGLRPAYIPVSRVLVEIVISSLFILGRTGLARWLVERIPSRWLGPLFDFLRKRWKDLSRPVKRSGLWGLEFEVTSSAADVSPGAS